MSIEVTAKYRRNRARWIKIVKKSAQLPLPAPRRIHHVEMGRSGDQSYWPGLQIDDKADPAAKPLLRTLEIDLASRKPNQPGPDKGMPGQDGVAVKSRCVPPVHRLDRLRTR